MDDFNNTFKEKFEKLGIEIGDITRAFNVSRITVHKWLDGTSKPHHLIQPLVIKWLDRRLKYQRRIKKSSIAVKHGRE